MAQIGDAEDEDKNLLVWWTSKNIEQLPWRGIKLILVAQKT
jgi:hypothetical protein